VCAAARATGRVFVVALARHERQNEEARRVVVEAFVNASSSTLHRRDILNRRTLGYSVAVF
jgi:hypothetical protein